MNPRTSTVLSTLLAIGFGFGAVWVGSHATNLKLPSSNPKDNTASVSSALSPASTILRAIVTPKSKPVTILIGGDVMFDRNVRKIAEKNGYDSLLAPIAPLLSSADITAVNLEGPISSHKSKTLLLDGKTTKELVFTFAPQTAEALSHAGIDVVSLSNNHTDNFGMTALTETHDYLEAAGVKWFGDPWNAISKERIITVKNIPVAFVGYHSFQNGFDRVVSEVKRLTAEGNFVIVMPHWGQEYNDHPSDKMREQAHTLVDAGARAIIGAHPHVIMDHEFISGIPVFYSVGNLLFDQYFSAAVMKGNIVELTIERNGDRVDLTKIRTYDTSISTRNSVTVSELPTDIELE